MTFCQSLASLTLSSTIGFASGCAAIPNSEVAAKPSLASQMRLVTVTLTDGGHTFCSGTWVSQSQILTAAHCVAELDAVTYKSPDSAEDGLAAVSVKDVTHDLAVLTAISGTKGRLHALAGSLPVAGDTVSAMGHPLGVLEYSYTEGQVSAIRTADSMSEILSERWDSCRGCQLIQATTPITPGNSGGGLFNQRGELVGVCSFTMFDPFTPIQNLNFFIPVSYAKLR